MIESFYMWYLVIVFLKPMPDGSYPNTILEKYREYSECAPEAERVMAEMQKAYPGDTSYTIVCWNQSEKQT